LTVAKRQVTTAANKAVEAEAAGKEAAVTVEKDKAAFNRARDQVHKAEAALEQARNMNHAAALRPTLKQGDPCPVCEQAVERLPRRLRAPELEDCEKAVEQAKRAESRAARTLEESRHVAASAASQAKERREVAEDRLADVQRIEKEITRISKKLTGVVAISHPGDEIPAELFKAVSNEANRWMALKQQFDAANERFNSADRTLQQARHRKEQAATTLKHLASRNEELRTRLSQLQEEQSEIASRIAAVTKNPDPAAERQELAKQVSDVEAADRRAEEALQTARRSLEAATARVSSAGKALSDRRADASSAADDVRAALADSGFADSSAVRAAALSSDEQQRLDTAIRGYDSERHQTEVRIFELENALAGRYVTEQDRRDADDEARGARDAHEAAAEMLTRSRHEVDRLGAQVERAMELRREVTAIETRVSLSDRLARDLKNDGFQRYLLEEAFRGLVDGASARMRQWTNRYTLEWDDGAFYAIDHDNGGERRRAETLSGGETFLASLSLALQLSEEVLRTAGAVQIDSLFIDEGFSTLDLEALDVVAEAIESLRIGGRMVGIITHIRDLTERLPGCIEVEKGQGESRWAVARVG
jgi:exonuclease SbcC